MSTRLSGNPEITPQEVMQMEDFKGLTEEQAIELLKFFDEIVDIFYNVWSKQQLKQVHTIPFITTFQSKAA